MARLGIHPKLVERVADELSMQAGKYEATGEELLAEEFWTKVIKLTEALSLGPLSMSRVFHKLVEIEDLPPHIPAQRLPSEQLSMTGVTYLKDYVYTPEPKESVASS